MKLTEMFNVTDFVGSYSGNSSVDDSAIPARNSKSESSDAPRSYKKTVLFSWHAASRMTQNPATNQRVLRSMVVIAVIIGLLLVAMQEFLLILAIASLVFVKYLISATPIQKVTHEITNLGMVNAGTFYPWDDLKQFFFTKNEDNFLLCVDTKASFPGRVFFMIENTDKDKIQDLINEYLPFLEQAPKDFVTNTYSAMMDKFVIKE